MRRVKLPILTLVAGLLSVGSIRAAALEDPPPATANDARGSNSGPAASSTPQAAGDQEPPPTGEELQPGRLPSLSIKFFSDVRARLITDRETKENQTSFSLNEVDTLITSDLSPKVQVLSEVIYHFVAEENATDLDVERLQIRYTLSKYLSIIGGRVYIPVSYWNYNFHHVIWFQTAANRPDMHRFEDEGGLLPTHGVGLNFMGRLETKALDLDYTVLVSNGRAKDPGATQVIDDQNKSKALSFYLMASPNAVPGLSVGGSMYLDKLPTELASRDIRERILSAYLSYAHKGMEVLAEYNGIRHEEPVTGRRFNTTGYYAQGAYNFGRWKPYYRFDRQDPAPNDPYFGTREKVKSHSVGVRWDVLNWNAIMGEYAFRDTGQGRGTHEYTIRSAFTF